MSSGETTRRESEQRPGFGRLFSELLASRLARTAVGLALTLPLACSGEGVDMPEEESAAEVDEAIIGGLQTFQRPEVGRITTQQAGSCTAILITPQWFLTAAHCVWHQALFSGGTFLVNSLNGVAQTRSVQATMALGGKACNTVGCGAVSVHDLAVGRLTSPVDNGWSNGFIARSRLAAGSPITLVGYGCDNQDLQTGSGVKRYFEGALGSTKATCFGDSGGPAFEGGLTDDGPIIGVTSGETAQSVDVFADPVWHEDRIFGLIRQGEGELEPGVLRSGAVYSSITVTASTPQIGGKACLDLCMKDFQCRAMSYEHGQSRCSLKSAQPPARGASRMSVVSAPATWAGAFDLPGSTYATVPGSNLDLCASNCGMDSRCRAYTFTNNTCSLKDSVPAASTSCPTCVSGIKRVFESGWDCPGNDLMSGVTASATACSAKCAKNENCKAFTFDPLTQTCFLKNAQGTIQPATSLISGVRRGYNFNTNRPGGDYRNFPTTDPRPEVCQSACALDGLCLSWTLVTETTGAEGRCYLKSSVRPRTVAQGMISGAKGMEFF